MDYSPKHQMCRCLTKLCTTINRLFNLILALIGLATLSYGLFILKQTNFQPTPFPVSVTSWGGVLFLVTLTYTTCGYKSSACNCFYALIMLLFFLINAIGVVFYFTHETEAIHYLNKTLIDVPTGLLDPTHIKTTITITLYVIAGLSGLILIGALVALCQRSILISGHNYSYDDDDDDNESYRSLTSESVVPKKRRNDLDRAVKKSEATVAANRFREKYSDMYDKYNIQSN